VIPKGRSNYANLLAAYQVPRGAQQSVQLPPRPADWGDDPQSFALAVSEDGNTVVGNTGTAFNEDAFIWTPASGMLLLVDYAAARGVAIPPGFLLLSANAISADGKTIAGNGIDPTGSFVVPWVLDLHGTARDILVTVEGAITANDLPLGPFAGYPIGAAVNMTFRLQPSRTSLLPGHASDYPMRANSFQINASYLDWNDYSHHLDSDTLDAASAPVLHLSNDTPRADAIDLDASALMTSGQSVQLHVSDAGGSLLDADRAEHVNRSYGANQFDAATWNVSDGVHSMNVAVQFLTIKDDEDVIFNDGFGD